MIAKSPPLKLVVNVLVAGSKPTIAEGWLVVPSSFTMDIEKLPVITNSEHKKTFQLKLTGRDRME